MAALFGGKSWPWAVAEKKLLPLSRPKDSSSFSWFCSKLMAESLNTENSRCDILGSPARISYRLRLFASLSRLALPCLLWWPLGLLAVWFCFFKLGDCSMISSPWDRFLKLSLYPSFFVSSCCVEVTPSLAVWGGTTSFLSVSSPLLMSPIGLPILFCRELDPTESSPIFLVLDFFFLPFYF